MRPTFTILIGSKGRDTLAATLESILAQDLAPGDQVYVGFDALTTPPGAILRLERTVDALTAREDQRYHAPVTAYTHTGVADRPKVIPGRFRPDGRDRAVGAGEAYSWLGVEQINHALATMAIAGSHVLTLGDDDVFLPGALAAIREVCARDQSRPVLYRFLSPGRSRLWDRPRLKINTISGCCIAAPRQYVTLHPTDIEPTHDFRWIVDIVDQARTAGRPPIWFDYLAVVARPKPGEAYDRGPGYLVAEVAK